ncbi:hypothetical protein PQR46_18785 [Paraburkholderia sediminicola]|uniref:hypothetical protein n=1 Tax=Paraburkholderia TaxID=1822464 RepID=UPI0038B8C6D9
MSTSNQSTASMAVSVNLARRGARVNSSGHVGVSFDKRTGRYQANVTLADGKRKFVGRAPTAAEAAALRTAFIAEHGTADPLPNAATATGEAA